MSYLKHITYSIRCDWCGRRSQACRDADQADGLAREDGWRSKPDGMGGRQHYCPNCVNKPNKDKPLGE